MSEFLLAEFASKTRTAEVARAASDAGHPAQDVLSPSPIEGIDEYLARPHPSHPIGWVMFIAGAAGGAIGYLMQWYSAVADYPIDSGGRPLNSWPAFLLVPYEAAILSAAIVGLLAWMWMCGLPKLFHFLFTAAATERAVQDRYLLVFMCESGLAQWIETHLQPLAIHEIRE
jgi:hypothetical protein